MKYLIFIFIYLLINLPSYGQRSSPAQNLQKAKEFIDKNKEEKALIHLNECIYKQPNNLEALFLRGKIYNNQKEFLKALTDYNALLTIDPENKEALYSRGIVRYQLEQFQMALEDFTKCMELPSKETNTAYFKLDPVSNKAAAISTMSTMEVDLWNYIGLCHYQLNQSDEALVAFNSGLKLEPYHTDLLINRALTYEKIEKFNEAKADYKRVLKLHPDHEIASINDLRLQTSDEKLQSLNSFIIQHPDRSFGYAERGLIFYEMEEYLRAEDELEKAYQIDPEDIEIQMNLALVKLKLDKLDQAESLLHRITENQFYKEKAYFNLGNVKFRQNNYQQAISFYTIAIQINNKHPSYFYNRALAYYESKKIDMACEDIKTAQLLDPEIGIKFQQKNCSNN